MFKNSLSWDIEEILMTQADHEEHLRTHGPRLIANLRLQAVFEGRDADDDVQEAERMISGLTSH